jgi:hypothetical protein
MFPNERALTAFSLLTDDVRVSTVSQGGKLMRLYRLSMGLAVVCLALGFGYSTSQALPGACAVGLNIHPGAWILLYRHPIARCTSGGGCKCVSCYNLNGSVSAVCYPLLAPIPGGPTGR